MMLGELDRHMPKTVAIHLSCSVHNNPLKKWIKDLKDLKP